MFRATRKVPVVEPIGSNVNVKEIKDVLPKDAIPAINNPQYLRVDEADYRDEDLVLTVTVGNDHRAFPIRIMNWHEIVNDTIGGKHVVATYCPLCGSGVAFDRNLEGKTYTFGVSGKLYMNALVMYDRETSTLWSHISGQSLSGPLVGKRLTIIAAEMSTFGEWKRRHPDGKVLSTDTGFSRDYSTDPYLGYDRSQVIGIFGQQDFDRRLPDPKVLVLGFEADGKTKAYPLINLPDPGVVKDEVGGTKILIVRISEADISTVYENTLNLAGPFERKGRSDFQDSSTGTLLSTLPKLPQVTAYWFAWADFHPETDVYMAQ